MVGRACAGDRPYMALAMLGILTALLILALATSHTWLGLVRGVAYAVIDSLILSTPLCLLARRRLGCLALLAPIILLIITGLVLDSNPLTVILKPLSWLSSLIRSLTN